MIVLVQIIYKYMVVYQIRWVGADTSGVRDNTVVGNWTVATAMDLEHSINDALFALYSADFRADQGVESLLDPGNCVEWRTSDLQRCFLVQVPMMQDGMLRSIWSFAG